MATVKFTSSVSIDVADKINSAYTPRLQAIRKEMQNTLSANEIIDAYIEVSGGRDLYEKTKHWMPLSSSVEINRYKGEYVGERRYINGENSSIQRAMPTGIEDALRDGNPCFETVFVKYVELKAKWTALETEKSETMRSVTTAFNAYPSVNAAVKAHPALESMLPEHVKERMAMKVERSRSDAVKVELDEAKVKSIATISKLYA